MKAEEIRKLVKIVEESNIQELEVSRWWTKVRITKGNSSVHVQSAGVAGQPPAQVGPSPAASPPTSTPEASSEVNVEKSAEVAEAPPVPKETRNTIEVRSPMVGTFYRAPAPDAEPYVKEGDYISPGKVLCIIEAMKLMNEIEAEISGRIVSILVENGEPVEYNQPLFLVEPD